MPKNVALLVLMLPGQTKREHRKSKETFQLAPLALQRAQAKKVCLLVAKSNHYKYSSRNKLYGYVTGLHNRISYGCDDF